MILYTINNVYPDKNFCFTIDAKNLGLVETEHTHVINNFRDLKNTLALYSEEEHAHQKLDSIKVNDNVLLNEIEINRKGNINLSVKNDVLILEFKSERTNVIGGLKNSNPNKSQNILKLWTGNLFENDDDSEFIIFKGDNL